MKKKYVLITGGSRGIGAGIAERLNRDGYQPLILDLVEPASELNAKFYKTDLSDANATIDLLNKLSEEFTITRLVNNVGIVRPEYLENTSTDDFDQVMRLNTQTAMICVQSVIPAMRKSHFGRIVSITSRSVLGKEMRTAYAASKGALAAMSRTWALELAGDGITVNTVAPGPIETELFRTSNPPESPKTKAIVSNIPVRRMGSPADVAQAVSYFMDENTGFVTGQTLYVCGGLTIGTRPE